MADNRYYYFKDAKGNRHTVDKTAYDKDPMGFAKAFPGARMEVIDRKTGRRGDVSVKDASRVGDFGAHLFTGRTITRGKGKPNSSALGRAQQSVAQEKWGGGVVTHENTTASENVSAPKRNAVTLDDWNGGTTGKESELVKGLRAADMIRKRDEEQMPIDYTKPGAVKQMVGGARRAQKSLERRMEQAGQEAGRNAEGEIRRRNAPAFDLGNEDVNNNIVKTRGQLEKEMEESAATIADKNFADTFANMIAGERQAAEKRGFDAYLQRTVFSATPMGSTLLGTIAYNAERDPAKLQQNLLNTLGKNMESMLSDPNVAQKVVTESKRLGVDPEDYVKTALMPSIQNKLMSEYDKTELKEWMPRNTFVDIIDGLGDGFQVGSILDAALTKAQRQYRQRAIIATQNGENPYYQRDKYGVTEGVRSALSLASDVIGPGGGVLGGIGKGVGAASAKVFGNEVKTIARMANMSKLQRMFKPSILMRGAAETGANFGIYEGLKGAQSYSSTTDDVKLGEMLENSAVSAAHGAVSGATLGVVGKMLGGLGYNVGIKGPMGVDPNFGKNMLKGLGMKGVQIIGEGTAFYAGGNFNNALSGADTDWSAGNLLSNIMAAGIYKIVSTHTATGAANMLTPEKGQSYGGSVAVKFGTALYKAAMAPSAQGKAFAFTPDEKQQLFASGDKAGLPGKEGSFGRQDILTWAERVMKATPVGKEDKSGNVKVAREYYESVMQDPNVSWDAKMKLNALLGIAPATRPEMDMRTYTIEDGKRYVNEYAKDGTLLSKRSYKNMEQREAIEYDLMMQKENQRMLNGLGYILNRDCSRMDLQMEFLRQHDYDFDNPDSPRNQAIMDDMLGNNKTLTLKRGRTLHDEWLDFVSENGITTKLIKDIADAHGLSVEEMFKIVNKEPIKRTEEEQRACVELRKALNNIVYEDGMPHADQADSDGKDVVEENNLGTENPNNEAVAEVMNNMNNAEKAFNAALESNDVLKQEYERLTKEGLSEPQIYMELINSGLTQEQLAPYADYINAKAKAVGMYRGTEQKIAETVQKHVEQWSYKGELNGEKQEGGQMLFVKDNNGRVLIVGAGDVAFDSEGRARENVGDMLSVLDPNTKEMDFVSKKDVQLDHVEKTEDYAKNYQEMLEVKNSVVYAQNEQQKQMENAAGGVSPEGGKPNGEEGVKHSYTLGEKKAGNGEPFYQDESGNIDLATIPDEVFEGIGYTKAPFRLTPSMIKHMLDRHNKELGFKDEGEAINFVVDVMNNFDHVRLGYDGALVFSIENGRKRTGKRAVTVLINSDNGEFYGLKTSGYEGIKGLEKRPLLWERGANETSSTDAASASVTTSKGPISGGQSGSASHQGNGLHDKDSNNSPNGNGNKETLTFADGSPVPMMKDTKGRETADYSQMTPEHGAEWMSSQFGENAEAAVDGQIKRAEKMLKEAEKIKVDYTGDLNDAKEAEAQKAKAVDAAKAELELYTNIKKVMTANKVKAGMEKVGSAGEEGSVSEAGNLGAVREKFESGKRIVGNKRTRTLADGSKLRGHYEIVEADSLTPSHNANDGYKKSEGFPVNEEGRTINDRDYENDKQAQLVTDMIAMKYDGQAVDQVPVVTSDGIVVDGNGRTMAGQKAAKNGTDSAYLEALKENAENYGFTAEQIEQSGIKHPRLVLVSDEPMKYDTATFAKFNKNEKKSQGNTQQAVANSKKISADEIGTIISEIEGSGSLDAFFNNPTAINSLLKRLIDKGVIGLNEVAGLREGEDKLSAAGKDFVKNLLLGSVFSENTIRMMGADAMLKTKALNGIRAVTDNMKLGDYALMKEIDQAVQLLYEARQGGSGVDAYLRTPAMFGENAADRFDPISQAIALALEGKAEDFRELMMAYNRNAAPYADANQTEMFGERPTKEDFIKEFLKLRNWKDYETRHSSKEGNGDAGSSEGTEPQAPGGNVITSEADYNKAVEQLKEAKGEERERILDQMGEYVKEFAKSNGYDEPVVLRTKQDLADAAKTENDKTIIENMPEGAHYPGYYEDGKIHIYLEGSTGSEELRETFEHESVHADNEVDPSRVEALVYSITDMNTLTREELERVVEVLSNMKEYTERASEMDDVDALYMLADEALAHLVTYAQEHGKDAMSEITDNPTLLNIAEKSLKERENDRRRKEGLAKSGDKTLERKNLDDVSTEENGGALEGDKEGKPGNDNGGSPDRDVQARKGQREVDGTPHTNANQDPLVRTTKESLEKNKAEYLKALKEGKTGKDLENAELHYKFSFLDYQNVMGVTDAESLEKLWKRELESAKTSETESPDASQGLTEPVGEGEAASEGTVKERKQALLMEIDRGGIKKKDDAFKLLYKTQDLLDDYYGIPHDEWGREPSRNNTIDTILGWARNTLEKIKDESIEPATERQMSYIEKLNTDDPTTQKMLEGVELNKRQASWLINKLKYVNENLMHMTREDIEDTMKEIHDGIEHFKKVNGKSEGEKPEGDGKALKTNPLEGMRKAAELFKDEQIEKARAELAEAKKSGDASEVKRLTDKLKGLIDSKLRGNGIGLVERRRIIGKELGKVLGEEAGKAEAEKVDKPWEQMDLEEREAVSSKNPLTETEINELTSEENRELIPAALAYLRGDKSNIINAISYFKIWNDVRSRHENVPDNSGTKDGTQLDAPNTGGRKELGLGRGREGGGPDGPVDRTDSERTAPGERESGTGSENNTTVSAGKPSVDKGEGNTPRMDAVSAGSSDTRGGGGAGNEGNVPKRGGQGGGNRPLDPNAGRKPAAKQGTHFPDSTSERLKQERAEYEQKKKDFWERWKKAGQGYVKIALTPFKSLNLSPEQIEMLPELFKMHLNGAVLKIKEGIYKFNEWKAAMRAEEGEELKMIGLSDDDIDRFIEDYWNTPYQMDGETHTIGEWAGIHGNEKLRNKLSEPLNDKYQRQVDAEPIKVKVGDKKNIEETLPYLLPQQQEDVLRAETQFFGNEHADREHAYGKGYMFTNGTGTGKTFTGLGIAKRLVKQGKGRILIVTPSQKKVSDWIKDGRNLNMEIRDLDDWAKERGTTATTESGDGVVITTFANFGVNKKLLETKWDAVIYDESHRIMENKNGTETARSMQHYMVTNRDESHCFLRLQETNKDYQKQKSLGEQFDIERAKETERIRKEYKASHPSATERDVAYATSRMVPRDVYNFTPSDYVTFPVLGKIHAEYVKALSHYTNEVKPKLEAQAKTEWKDTKTIFLSATPFNTRENLDYVEGYIFKYPESDERGMSGRTQFYLNHFGAAYKYRYHRLEQSTNNPEAVAKQEIAFSDYLQHTLGTMSGRIIDSPYDYSRDFPTVSPDHAEEFNQAVQDAVRGHGVLADAYRRTIGDYNYGSALFETMKVANIIERIKAHLDAGRKVVIFHRRVETKEPLKPPFALMLEQANHLVSIMSEGEEKKEAAKAVRDFRKKYADLLEWEQTLDYSMPREQIAKVFGKDKVLFFSGKESSKVKDKAVDTFNSDDSGKNIIVIQEASGKEGISLHDTTGKHQRVCITLALPQSPITALQIEGRTYRIGNKSNAIFEYPVLGLNSEMMLFGEKFNNQVSTTENLALGSQARSLRDSFAKGILEHSGVVPIDQQGVGGKEFDAPKEQDNDPFDSAVLDYYSNQKLNSRNREGVDYFPTPEPLGYKMMEWANMGEGDTVLEPSAGHGAIARYAPKGNQMVAIEPSQSLFTKLQLKAGGLGRKFQNTIFENYDIGNKHDVVVMNPPFGTAGATAIAHLGKAFKHLEEGGRVVAIIPRGSTDKKFEKWIEGEKTAVMRAEVELPDILFEQAGTHVVCRVVVVDKISNEAMRAKTGSVEKWDLGGHYDKIEDFFEDLRDVEMPDRIIDTNAIMMKKSKQTVKDLKELKGVRVDLNEHGINVRVRGDWKDYSIMFDLGEYNAEQRKSILSGTYERLEENERQTSNETSQAVIAELKKLTCKLADMTEEEMQRYLQKQNDGKGVMYRVEHAAEVYNKANAHYRMELGNTFSDSKEHFDAVRDRAVEEKGIVMPNLNKEKVKVVEVEKHSFKGENEGAIENARAWAKENLVTTNKQELPTMRDGTPYTISKKAVDKYLSSSAVNKSDELGVHLSVLPKLTDVIHESIEAEIHADYNVKDETGKRKAELGYGNNILVHRLYGAVEMDGKIYRVKTTMQEFRGGEENKPHSYEVTKIELLDSPGKRENPDRPHSDASNNSIDNKIELPDTPGTAVLPDSSPLDMTPSNSKNITSEGSEKANESDSLPLNSTTNGYISTAKLLQGVEKSYDSGKKLLDESKDLTDGETFFRKEGNGVVTPEKTSNAMSERIIKTVEKVAKRTGGKVKMVNSVDEIENPKVRKDIENGKQVTGWYDEKTGEVHLYMPNIHDTYTAEKTVWHETVGHKGMRGLLGDKFNDYMRSLWMDLDNPINAELRAYVKEKMNMNHLGFYDAIEEFIAKSAEDGKGEPGFWNYIKNKVTDALHEIGYRVSPNVKDVKYMLWLAKNVQKHDDSPLWKMRAEAVKWKIEHEKTSSVVEENGMMYDNNGKKHGLLDLNKKDFDEATDGYVHYRTSPMTASKIEEYNRRLSTKWYAFKESTVDDMQSLQEAMQIISGVKDAYADIPSAFNPLQCHNRMGSMVMQMCERYDREYTEPLGDAFKKVVSAMPGKDGAEQTRNANLYFIKKHGLERNRVLFVRDKIREKRKEGSEKSDSIDALEAAWNGEKSDLGQKLRSGQIDLREYYRQMDEWIVRNIDKDFKAEEHDYSGMHGIYDVKKGEEYDDANVIDEVTSTESQLGADLVKSFWDAKKKATDFTIDQEYANGFKDKNERNHLKEMFDWYVPLRKFDETVAEDVYGYISGGDTKNEIGSVIEKASGRESLSDVNVLAQISALAKSSIINGGKNVEKQHFMRFVEAYEKGDAKDRIFVEIKPWAEKHTVDGNEVWEEVMPNIPENSTQEQINDILNTFEDTMKAKQAQGKAKIARMKSDIGYKFERSSDMNQHIVNVYVNGRVRRFVCQGNPRAAQAINGLLRDSGTQHWATEQSAKLNRYCAQLNTSLNPDFLSSNLVRDLTAGSANLVVKEGMGYTWDFCMEYAKNWGAMVRRKDGGFDGGYLGMFRRYKDGRLDANNQKERWFKEFMDNGGETGFVSLKKYEDIIKEYENLVKTGNKDGDRWLMKKLKEGGAFIELANEVVENVARYSTYCVSRKRGRSIGKSIYDAKEVSSNFNRHGSGDAVKSLKTEYDGKTDIAFRKSVGWFNSWMKNHTMFYNAGVQGANLFTKNLKHAPKTFAIAFGAMPFGLSLAVALFNLWRIGREDEKKRNGVKNPYAELPEWKRRNNLCIYLGGGKFKTIPMGIELRAFYGLGDIAAGYMVDESLKSDTPIGLDIIGQMAQLVPASDFLGHHSPSSGIKELGEDVALSVIPTIAKPEFELAFNRDWTGRPIYRDKDYLDRAPRWKRAYDSTNDVYMTINKWANKTFNGIDSTNEDLKGNGMMADAVDFFTAPYGLQHIVEGYTGGAGATIGRIYQTGKSLVKGVVSGVKDEKGFAEGFNKEWDKVDPNTILFYRVFNYTPKEGNDMQRTKSKWYNYVDELEQLKYNMQQMKTNTPDTAKNIHNAASKFKLSQSKEGRQLKIYEAADRYIAAKRRILKKAKDKAVVEAVNEAINRKMQEAVEDLDRIE